MFESDLVAPARYRILLVDDSEFDRVLLGRILEQRDYEVHAAANAEEALARLEELHPDLILLDVCMPGMDGYELCRRVHALPACAGIPIIFISANGAQADRIQAFASGGVDYLVKPIEAGEVQARVANHLTLQSLRQNLEAQVRLRTQELEQANRKLISEIAERRAAENSLRERNALIHCLVDANIIGIMFLRQDGQLLDANKAFLDLFGLERADIEAGRINWLQLIAPEDLPMTAQALDTIRRMGRCLPYEKLCLRRDGTHLPVLIGSARLPEGDVLISFVLDLSERKRIEEELRASQQHLRDLAAHGDAAMEQERKRIAREIHDEQGSLLTALKLDLSLLRREIGSIPQPIGKRMDSMQQLIDETVRVMRQVAAQLRPASLNLGVLPSLEWLASDFCRRTGIPCRLASTCEVALDDVRATALFRIVQESLTNVTRHAAATEVDIALENGEDALQVRIHDNGRGFDPAKAGRNSFGLRGIQERLEILGGRLDIDSAPGLGTTLHIAIPLEEATI